MKKEYKIYGNPYLPLWEHLPDGEPRVFEDPDNPGKERLYIIGSHDVLKDRYCGPDIRIWSADVEDLSTWRDEGAVFTYDLEDEVTKDIMYAPDLVEVKRKGGTKEYYLYPHSRGPNREAMVCKGPSPVGPFTPLNLTADGKKTVEGSIMGFDPSVYIEYVEDEDDPDFDIGFRAYGFWGFQEIHAAQLDQTTMYSLRPGTEIIDHFIPASNPDGSIRDPWGTTYPYVFEGEDLKSFNFFEASSIRKVGNKFLWVYSGYSGQEYGLANSNSTLRYAYGDSPLGPWRGGSVLVDSRAIVAGEDGTTLATSYGGHNTHGSIQEVNGQWYAFYHRCPRSFGYARQSVVAPVQIQWEETPVAQGGTVSIRAFDPYAPDKIWTAKSEEIEYTGAEVTSEGFSIYGLDPFRYYSAGIACYLSDESIQTDSYDKTDDGAPLTNIRDGDIIGYKYFDFEHMDEEDRDTLDLNLLLISKSPYDIHISLWVDGPWDNDAWNGQKIGELHVGDRIEQEPVLWKKDISKATADLRGKHALFLVVESGEKRYQHPLFDLIGLGFSSQNHPIKCNGKDW